MAGLNAIEEDFVLSPATPAAAALAAAALVLGPRYDVVRANAVKEAIVLGLTLRVLIASKTRLRRS